MRRSGEYKSRFVAPSFIGGDKMLEEECEGYNFTPVENLMKDMKNIIKNIRSDYINFV
jgi:hypothetical protein